MISGIPGLSHDFTLIQERHKGQRDENYMSPITALCMRQFKFAKIVNLNFGERPSLEKWKFDRMRRLLLEFGLDESLVHGNQGLSAEDYCKRVTEG